MSLVGRNSVVNFIPVHILLELIEVQTQLLRLIHQNHTRCGSLCPHPLRFVKSLGHFPKLFLVRSCLRRAGGELRMLVRPQRKMSNDHPHLVAKLAAYALDHRFVASALRTLHIAEELDRDGRVRRAHCIRRANLVTRSGKRTHAKV